MSLDLFEKQTEDRLSSMTPIDSVEAGAFDGFARGTLNTTMKGFAEAASGISLLGAVGPTVQDYFTGGTEARDRFFKRHDEVFGRAVEYWTPEPGEVGVAGQIAGSLLSTIPMVFASPPTAVAATQMSVSQQLAKKGVEPVKAQAAGAAFATGLGLGIWVPILGQTLTQRMLLGGAGFNVAQGVATRGAAQAILQGTPGAEDYQAFSTVDITLDALLGLAFGGFAHLSPAMRKESADFLARAKQWREGLTPEQVSALQVMRQAQHASVESVPGIPADPMVDIDAHMNRLRTAIGQLAVDQPVHVTDLPAAETLPDLPRVSEMMARARELVVDSFEANIREQLDQVGRFSPETNQAYAKLTREFYEATARRLGIGADELIGNYKLGITGDLRAFEQIPRADTLAQADRDIEARMAQRVADVPSAAREYARLKDSRGGKILNTDVARELSPDYRSDRTRSAAVHEPASWLIKQMYARKLREPPKGDETPRVLFTAGGTGSGKTTALDSIPEMKAMEESSQIIYDTNMATYQSSKQKIDQALAAGKEVAVAWVYRDTIDSLKGALKRAEHRGRTVPIDEHLKTHQGAALVVPRLAEAYANDPRVTFIGVDNSLGANKQVLIGIAELAKKAQNEHVGVDQLRQIVEQEREAGRISEATRRGFTGDRQAAEAVAAERVGTEGRPDDGREPQGADQVVLAQGPRSDWVELEPQFAPGERLNPLAPMVPREGIRGAQGRLTRAIERASDVGGPDNPRVVLEKDGKRLVIGKITPQDWIDRVNANMSPAEIKAGRQWYGDLHNLMARFFGEENAEKYSLAWLLSQQNESPSGGMRNVLRASDMARGLPEVKKAGLAQQKLIETLRGQIPKEGYDAKLLDFIDSEMRRSTRTVMGDDPRGGKPAVIDVWANRDVGKVDDRVLRYIIDNFGEEASRHVQVDGAGIGETDYEFGSKFYNRLAEELNALNVDGGGWLPLEVQAVGWMAMQKQMGARPEVPIDIFEKNTRRVSIGLAPGAGSPMAGKGEFTREAVTRVVGTAADATGVKVRGAQHGVGSYLGDTEGSMQVDVLGSPEAQQDFAAVVGHALQQTEVIISRPLASGNTAGVTLLDATGGKLGDPAAAESFMAAVREKLPEGMTIADGYQMLSVDGRPGLRILHGTWNKSAQRVDWSGSWKPAELKAFRKAVDEVAEAQGFKLDADVAKYDVVSEYNDWSANPNGEGYRRSLMDRGRSKLESGLDEFRVLPNEVRAPTREVTLAQPERGQISLGPKRATISLFEGADLSTYLHESGHLYLEVYTDLAGRRDLPPEISQDLNTLFKWFGVKDINEWQGMSIDEKRPHHEKFAKAFEQYLMEGKAPRPGLKGLFDQFKSWLMDVYQTLTNVGADLTPEVSRVFDRMLRGESPQAPKPVKVKVKPEVAKETDPLAAEVDRFVTENPDLIIHTGQDANGDPISVKLSDFVSQERLAAEQAMKDSSLFRVAADCMLGATG